MTEYDLLTFEQYQCRKCGRFFYIDKKDKSDLDFDGYNCPYGCDHGTAEEDMPTHTRTFILSVNEVKE